MIMIVQIHELKRRKEEEMRRNKRNSIINEYEIWLMSEQTYMYINKEETHTIVLKKERY